MPSGQDAASRGGAVALLPVLLLLMAAPSSAELVNTKLNGPIVDGGGVDRFRISPDGNWVVYKARQENASVGDLYSVPIEGGTPTRLNSMLPQNSGVASFSITPDSRHVVLTAPLDTSPFEELYRVPIEGPAHARIKLNKPLPTGGGVWRFEISPDGKRVVYWADQDADEVFELYSVPTDGPSTAGVKINGPLVDGGDVWHYKISPNGARVIYLADQHVYDNAELYSVPIAGPADAWVKLNGPLVSQGGVDFDYAITADTSRVVYRARQQTVNTFELYSVPIEGPASLGQRINGPLVNDGEVWSFQVSPDDSRVVYLADQEVDDTGELYSVPIIGPASSCVKLNKTLVAGGDVSSSIWFHISADSSRVVYVADQETDEKDDIYSVPIGGPADEGVMLGGLGTEGDVSRALISPDSERVVYRADPAFFSTSHVNRLFTIPIDGPLFAVNTLNDWPSAAYRDADVQMGFQISPSGQFVVYAADQETDGVFELYRVPIAGPAGTDVKLNGTVTGGGLDGTLADFSISPDSRYVVYLAEQDTVGVTELYVSYDRPTAAKGWKYHK